MIVPFHDRAVLSSLLYRVVLGDRPRQEAMMEVVGGKVVSTLVSSGHTPTRPGHTIFGKYLEYKYSIKVIFSKDF